MQCNIFWYVSLSFIPFNDSSWPDGRTDTRSDCVKCLMEKKLWHFSELDVLRWLKLNVISHLMEKKLQYDSVLFLLRHRVFQFQSIFSVFTQKTVELLITDISDVRPETRWNKGTKRNRAFLLPAEIGHFCHFIIWNNMHMLWLMCL